MILMLGVIKSQEVEDDQLEDPTEPPVINNYYCGQKGDKGEKVISCTIKHIVTSYRFRL